MKGFAAMTVMSLCISAFTAYGSLVCYKRSRLTKNGVTLCRKQHKRTFPTIRSCCTSVKGVAFSLSKVHVGRSFKCVTCESLGEEFSKSRRFVKTVVDNKRLIQPFNKPDYSVSVWGPWSQCSTSCGAGWRRRIRICDGCSVTDSLNYRIEPCIKKFVCPVDGNWGPWQQWQPCTKLCGKGIQTRHRHCNYPAPSQGGKMCPENGLQRTSCNTHICEDYHWGSWSKFSTCTTSCGSGLRTRQRLCYLGESERETKKCTGLNYERVVCQFPPCRGNMGSWSEWGRWGECAVTCGEGSRVRTRNCHPKQSKCVGKRIDRQRCYTGFNCLFHSINGGWSEWAIYSPCTARPCTDKAGFMIRSRTCTNPKPQFGGQNCDGSMYSTVNCINQDTCNNNGSWCAWSPWSPCLVTCLSELSSTEQHTRRRTRVCQCPKPAKPGASCVGTNTQMTVCGILPCHTQSLTRNHNQTNTEKMDLSTSNAPHPGNLSYPSTNPPTND